MDFKGGGDRPKLLGGEGGPEPAPFFPGIWSCDFSAIKTSNDDQPTKLPEMGHGQVHQKVEEALPDLYIFLHLEGGSPSVDQMTP